MRVYLNTIGANNTMSLYPWMFSFTENARSRALVVPVQVYQTLTQRRK